jgi:rRNA processing protein Gar1
MLLHATVHRQMLQSVLDPRANLHQLVPVNQQLAKIALLSRRSPQPRKTVFDQQLQNVARVSPVGLLLAHIAGANLGRIANPHMVAKPLQQVHKPLAVATSFYSNQRRRFQSLIKPLGFAIAVHQLVFGYLAGLTIKYCYLLPLRMKITA